MIPHGLISAAVGLICIDVDGTLVGHGGAVHPDVWAQATMASAAGIRVAICSGRPAFGIAKEYALRLDATGWHSFQNGASVVDFAGGRSRSVHLDAATVAWLIAHSRATNRMLEIYNDFEYAIESESDRARAHAALLGVPFAPRAFESLAGPIVRAQWMVAHHEVEGILAEPRPAVEIAASTSPVMPDVTFLNITPPGITKATAVREIAADYGVPLDAVMFVGDGNNDVPAMHIVGAPVAMANAEPSALAAARATVRHVDEGGLADAIGWALASVAKH